MFNDMTAIHSNEDLERNAFNAAFHDLGLRFHWDDATYTGLLARDASEAGRVHHYLETRQPHLLKAYDATFLVEAILQGKARHASRPRTAHRSCRHFDWAQSLGAEIGC